MTEIGICLGGQECGNMITDTHFKEVKFIKRPVEYGYQIDDLGDRYYSMNTITYKLVDLKFRKEIRQPYFKNSYVLKQPFSIYVPESEYDKYEGVLKFILSKWMEAEWEEV